VTFGPSIVSVFPSCHESEIALPAGAVRVWPDLPLWHVGGGHPGELRTVRHRDAGLLVWGQCFADDDRLARDLAAGPESFGRWPGSYAAILVRDTELAGLVDLAGQFPLYYRSAAGRTVLGSAVSLTAHVAGLPAGPDLTTLAAQVFCPDVSVLTGDRSVLTGILRLGGGQAIRVDQHGHCRVSTVEPLPPGTISLPEAATELRGALDNSVRARLDTGKLVTADLSGGLDSTSVAFLAARHSAGPLRVFTYHHPDAPAGDLAHAQRYAALNPKFVPEVVLGNLDTLPYQELEPTIGDLPDPAAVAMARTRLRLGRIAAGGSEIHLGGEGADALLTPSPSYLADLGPRALARHAYLLARRRDVSPAAVFRRAVTAGRTSTTRALGELAERLTCPRPLTWLDAIGRWAGPGVEAAWLTMRMRRELTEACRHAAAGSGTVDALHEVRAAGAVQRQLIETAREYRVWPQAPFLDNDVIRACTRVAAGQCADPAVVKPLLVAAMAGLVPKSVLARRGKGNYLGEDYRGVHRAALADLITDSRVAALGMVEPSAVLQSVEHARSGAPAPFPALNRLLGVELWLRGRKD
jgi:asparagine synthase (glutamine-hydrolysing)